ncbi:MAG: response regulator transcription factor [Christensenella sp.]|nr:MAG: response regulator transcription factor [Christensenella sp.]
MRKILIAEDNVEISDMMKSYLVKAGHEVYQAFDGLQALAMAKEIKPDIALLDIMMPGADGYRVCETLRKTMNMPIIVVSAKVAEEDKARMFDLGADDYITKPFSFKEMVMRVAAQLRRYYEFNTANLQEDRHYGNLMISSSRYEVKVDGEPLNLTAKEFKILDYLTLHENQIMPKQKIIDDVWGIDEYIDENTVAVTIARLRDKLAKVGVSNVVTVWGLGYKWQD